MTYRAEKTDTQTNGSKNLTPTLGPQLPSAWVINTVKNKRVYNNYK